MGLTGPTGLLAYWPTGAYYPHWLTGHTGPVGPVGLAGHLVSPGLLAWGGLLDRLPPLSWPPRLTDPPTQATAPYWGGGLTALSGLAGRWALVARGLLGPWPSWVLHIAHAQLELGLTGGSACCAGHSPCAACSAFRSSSSSALWLRLPWLLGTQGPLGAPATDLTRLAAP